MIIVCDSCFATTSVRHENPNFSFPKNFRFCPICGKPAKAGQNDEEEAWFAISAKVNLPLVAVKKLYELWEPNLENNTNFVEWIENAKSLSSKTV